MPDLRNRGNYLALEVMDADQQRVRVRVTSSMRPVYEGTRDDVGLDMAGVFELSDAQAGLVAWMVRQGALGLAEAAQYTGQGEGETRTLLEELSQRGFVAERMDFEGESRYEARMATRRRGAGQLWQALGEENDSPADAEASRPYHVSGVSMFLRRLSSSKYGSFLLGVSPVAVAFVVAEWLMLTGSGSFTWLLSFMGVIVVPLLGGILPVLLLLASRRKGERVPTAVYRFLGNPLLLAGIYVLFLASIFMHGLVIWSDPLQRVVAMLVGVMIVGLTLAMRRAFARRLIVELREEQKDQGERAFFSVTAAGRPAVVAR